MSRKRKILIHFSHPPGYFHNLKYQDFVRRYQVVAPMALERMRSKPQEMTEVQFKELLLLSLPFFFLSISVFLPFFLLPFLLFCHALTFLRTLSSLLISSYRIFLLHL